MGIAFLFLSLFSCSHILYTHQGNADIFLTRKKEHQRPFSYQKELEFYLFGTLPKKHILYLDRVLASQGIDQASGVTIREETTLTHLFAMIFSMGLYSPRKVTVEGWGR
jgi:hypothetical protein